MVDRGKGFFQDVRLVWEIKPDSYYKRIQGMEQLNHYIDVLNNNIGEPATAGGAITGGMVLIPYKKGKTLIAYDSPYLNEDGLILYRVIDQKEFKRKYKFDLNWEDTSEVMGFFLWIWHFLKSRGTGIPPSSIPVPVPTPVPVPAY